MGGRRVRDLEAVAPQALFFRAGAMGEAKNTMHTYQHVTSVWYKYRPIYVTTKKPNALSSLSNHLRVVVVTAEVGRGAVELDGLAVHAAVRAVGNESLLGTGCKGELRFSGTKVMSADG